MIELDEDANWRGMLMTWRLDRNLTQSELAAELGIGLRAYQDLESGKSKIKRAYMLALEFIGLSFAAEQGRPELASARGRAVALDVATAIRGA